MADKFILVVSDEGEGDHGEIAVLDTSHDVENTVASLLEAGFDQTRIQVFAGGEADVEITYRPVVYLMESDSDQRAPSASDPENRADVETVVVGAQGERSTAASNDRTNGPLAEAHLSSVVHSRVEAVRSEAESPPAQARGYDERPATQGHFSDLFRPAYGWSD